MASALSSLALLIASNFALSQSLPTHGTVDRELARSSYDAHVLSQSFRIKGKENVSAYLSVARDIVTITHLIHPRDHIVISLRLDSTGRLYCTDADPSLWCPLQFTWSGGAIYHTVWLSTKTPGQSSHGASY